MARCAGVERDGGQCTTIVRPPQSYCYQHDPGRAEERRRAASKGGKSKPSRELREIKARLKELAESVLSGATGKGEAAVCGQLYNVIIRAVGMEMKLREVEDLERRLEELEELMEESKAKEGSEGAWPSRTG